MTACESTGVRKRGWHEVFGLREDAWNWLKGVAVTLTITGLLFAAAARSLSTRPALNELCLKQIAQEEHTLLEAFFQNPVEQNAFVQAITECSR